MKIERIIDSRVMEISVEIPYCRDNLYIIAELSKEIYASVRIYNPDNLFIGEIVYGYSNFKNKIYYSKSNTTMNGLCHTLKSGIYRFVIIILEPEKITKDLRITLAVESSISSYLEGKILTELGQDVFQEQSWFNAKGSLIDFHRVTNSENRYYKGDFHGHTVYSDGQLTVDEARDVIKQQGLDFMALTEHNRIPFGFKKMDSLMIPSFELTLPSGHINIHGIAETDLIGEDIGKLTEINDIINTVVDKYCQYSNISINHMFLDIWSFTEKNIDLRKVNTIEVMCDPTYPTSPVANDKAVAFIDFLWNKGWKIYGIGGSDSHNKIDDFYDGANLPSIYGDPATYVFCQGLSVDNILKGIKNGNAYVTRYEDLNIIIGKGKILPGQEIINTSNFDYTVEIKNFGKQHVYQEYVGKFILNGEVIKTVILDENNPKAEIYDISSYVENSDYWWLRFGLYDISGHVVAYVNPIYHGERDSNIYELDQLLTEFYEMKKDK